MALINLCRLKLCRFNLGRVSKSFFLVALTSHRNLERSQTREINFFRNKKIIRKIFAAFDNHKKICKKPKSQINNPKKNSIPERKK